MKDVSRGVGCSLVALSRLLSVLDDWRRLNPGFLIGPVLRLRNSTCPSGEEMDKAKDIEGVDDVTLGRFPVWLPKVFPMFEHFRNLNSFELLLFCLTLQGSDKSLH